MSIMLSSVPGAPLAAEHGREGAIEVPADCPLLIIEGGGAGRQEVADLIDALIWVQSDQRETRQRSLARAEKPARMDLPHMASEPLPSDRTGAVAKCMPYT